MKEDSQPNVDGRTLGEQTDLETSKDRRASGEPPIPSSGTWVELLHHLRTFLVQLKGLIRLSEGRFIDKRFGEFFCGSLHRHLDTIEVLMKEYLDYIRVSTPIEKRDTVHHLIEDVLKKYQGLLEEKGIKLFKRFEPDLPETTVPEDPLRFVLNSLLWYALTWIAPIASMGFLTKVQPLRIETTTKEETPLRTERQDIEMMFVLSGHKDPLRSSGTPVEIPVPQREGIAGFMLRLIEEIDRNNGGESKIQSDPKKAWISFSLTFPRERRRKTYYRSSEE